MSREFGSYCNGYFHSQMEYAADDCREGSDELTRKWGKFFDAFQHIAYAIASSEACDSGKDYPIMESIKRMPEIKAAIAEVEEYLRPFKDVAECAVREAAEKEGL